MTCPQPYSIYFRGDYKPQTNGLLTISLKVPLAPRLQDPSCQDTPPQDPIPKPLNPKTLLNTKPQIPESLNPNPEIPNPYTPNPVEI